MADQMGEIFIARQQYIGFKLEVDRGTAIALANADFNILAENVKFKPNFKENQRKYAVGDPYPFQSIMGAQSGELSFSVHVQGSGSAARDPVHWTLLKASGFVGLTPSVNHRALSLQLGSNTATIQFEQKENAASPRGKFYRLKGAAATKLTEHYDGAGQLQKIDFTFLGAMVTAGDLTAGSNHIPVLTGDTSQPPAVLSVQSLWGSYVLPTNAITIDYGLKAALIEYPPDPTGYAYTLITDFDPVINLKVLSQLEASLGVYAALASGTNLLQEFRTTVGTALNQNIITFPNAQVVKGLEIDQRDGVDDQSVMLRAIRNTVAVNTFTIPLVGRLMPIT